MLRWDEVLAAEPTSSTGPMSTRTLAAAMCYERYHGNPKGVVYSHRSSYLHSLNTCCQRARRQQR